ncbi:MAG: helix-turn-helix transcriptional regulator [Rhodoferax sp.]|nr:helix-turn-helix transcriptional regulator [Rhodoferax sp.]
MMTMQCRPDQSPAEIKFLQTGKPNKVIATQLGISLGTTKCHLHNLYAVMQVQNRAEAIIKSRDWLL